MYALLVLLVLGAALLFAHYAGYDVLARYSIDGTVISCRSEGLIWKTTQLELKEEKTGRVINVTLPATGQEVNDLANAKGQVRQIRVYYERRAISLPWEGSTRRATGVDWAPLKEGPPKG
jgi:hypothetical protein